MRSRRISERVRGRRVNAATRRRHCVMYCGEYIARIVERFSRIASTIAARIADSQPAFSSVRIPRPRHEESGKSTRNVAYMNSTARLPTEVMRGIDLFKTAVCKYGYRGLFQVGSRSDIYTTLTPQMSSGMCE